MLTISHYKLGKLIESKIRKELDFFLDKRQFLFGCIRPDILANPINLPHTKALSFDRVVQEIEKLCDCNFKEKKNLKSFSHGLGIVIHYIADYFCYAHNSYTLRKAIPHTVYEIKLAAHLSNSINITKTKLLKYLSHFSSAFMLKNWLNYYHRKYLRGCHSLLRDLEYIVNITTILSMAIIRISLRKQKMEDYAA